jgi:hypothetical protein
MRRRPNVHALIVENEVLDVDKLAAHPHAGGRVEEMAALNEALPDRAASDVLIQPGQLVLLSLSLPDFNPGKVMCCLGLGATRGAIFR